jgi:hypothetical protein
MAIEDIIQIKESVKENPMGDRQTVNQAEFLRFQEQMGLGPDGVIAKLIQMFVEEPSEFTRKFGVEAADSVREFLGNTTQRELENRGTVFAPDSAEIIGQNIDYRPERSAIGTLQTDQADESEQMMEFMKKQLQFKDQIGPESLLRAVKEGKELQESLEDQIGPETLLRGVKEDFNPADYKEGYLMLMNNLYPDTDREIHEQEYDNWFRGGEGSEYYEDRKNRLLKLLSNMPGGGAGYESAEDFWKRAHPDQFDKEGNYIGKKQGETTDLDSLTEWMEERGLDGLNIDKSHLDRGENTLRVITDEEAEALGFKTGDGKIYQIDETGTVTLKEPGMIESGILKLMDWFKYGHTDPENR